MKVTQEANNESRQGTENGVKAVSNESTQHQHANIDSSSALQCNKLTFVHPDIMVSVGILAKEQAGSRRFHFGKLPPALHELIAGLDDENPFVWVTTEPAANDMMLEVNLTVYPAVAWYWYTQRIYAYMKKKVRLTRKTFDDHWQYWQEIPGKNRPNLIAFRKFTLKVITYKNSSTADLEVSYDGISYVVKRSLQELTAQYQTDTHLVGKVVYEREVLVYDKQPDETLYHPDVIYPVLRREIAKAMGIDFPDSRERFKLTRAYGYIQDFNNKFLQAGEFLKIIPHTKEWETVDFGDIHLLKNRSQELLFGEGNKTKNIYRGMLSFGPARLIPGKHIVAFMIYHDSDSEKAALLREFIHGDRGFIQFGAYTRKPLVYDQSLDIVLQEDTQSLEEVEQQIRFMEKEADTDYFAFYLSPYDKYDPVPADREVYYRVKEILLNRSIMSQAVDSNKFSEKNFKLAMANIGNAMIAKLGGIPWRLPYQPQKELVIGFGAYRSKLKKRAYVGSAFCFDNRGVFQEFNCWPAQEAWALHSTLSEAIREFRRKNKTVKRVVVHYYKPMRKKDFNKIETMIDDLDADVPVIVVRFNTSFDHSELVWDRTHPQKLPKNGCYVRLKYYQYLFYMNENNGGSSCKAAPFPLKLSFQSNRAGLLDDPKLIEHLMRQVYEFSLLHWRSIKQPRLPVTVAYPRLLASLFPWFEGEVLPLAGRDRLWFL